MTSSPLSGATSMPSMRPPLTRSVRASRPPGTTTCAFTNVSGSTPEQSSPSTPCYDRSTLVLRLDAPHDEDRALSARQLRLAPLARSRSPAARARLPMPIEGMPVAVDRPLPAVALERARPARLLAGGMHDRIDDAAAGTKHARDLASTPARARRHRRAQDRTPPDRSYIASNGSARISARAMRGVVSRARSSIARRQVHADHSRAAIAEARAGSGRCRSRRRAPSCPRTSGSSVSTVAARAPSAGCAAAADTSSPRVAYAACGSSTLDRRTLAAAQRAIAA